MGSRNPFKVAGPARIAFSGGRTSGYMLWGILDACGGSLPLDVVVTFANTGREAEETLRFVRECSERWSVPIRWVEYHRNGNPVVNGRGQIGCHDFREVTFETASRNGEPFDAIIRAKTEYRKEYKDEGPLLPNLRQRWCSGEMKHRTMDRFMRSLGYAAYSVYVGLRSDEPTRVADMLAQSTRKIEYVCPMARQVTEKTVLDFWGRQPFDLGLTHDPEMGTYMGNCDGCFLKRPAKIKRIHDEHPERLAWWIRKEQETGQTFRPDRIPTRTLLGLPVLAGGEDYGVCLCTD
jgi:3'-phosphoadenosine 5'-phosphosulfate sulfotransferase (PAPS reductase)/FAD synthetase